MSNVLFNFFSDNKISPKYLLIIFLIDELAIGFFESKLNVICSNLSLSLSIL